MGVQSGFPHHFQISLFCLRLYHHIKRYTPLFWGHIVQLRLFIYTERKEAGVQLGKGILDLQSVCGVHIPLSTIFSFLFRTVMVWWCDVSGLSGLVSI